MAAKDKKTTEVAVQPQTQLPATADMAMWQQDAGIGRESMSVQDMALPYYTLLQSLSPQVKKSSPTRIDGAEEGDIYNTVSQELFAGEEGLVVIPCAFQKAWVEWAPRDSGGGFVASHQDDTILQSCTRNEVGFDIRQDNGNLIVATFYYYVMRLKEDGGFEFGIVSMARTALKKARKWNSLLSSLQVPGPQGPFNPPMFAQKFQLNAVPESNPKGDYYNWNVQFKGLVADAGTYATAKKFAESVRSGAVKVSAPPSAESSLDDDEAF
jgi:hypothetical protein